MSEIATNVEKANKYKPADYIIKQASQNATEIAKGGNIDKVDELVAKFGGDRNSWKKMKGTDKQGREWHWYVRGDGSKIGWKIKGVHPHDPF